jgi:hypothetical protein
MSEMSAEEKTERVLLTAGSRYSCPTGLILDKTNGKVKIVARSTAPSEADEMAWYRFSFFPAEPPLLPRDIDGCTTPA